MLVFIITVILCFALTLFGGRGRLFWMKPKAIQLQSERSFRCKWGFNRGGINDDDHDDGADNDDDKDNDDDDGADNDDDKDDDDDDGADNDDDKDDDDVDDEIIWNTGRSDHFTICVTF